MKSRQCNGIWFLFAALVVMLSSLPLIAAAEIVAQSGYRPGEDGLLLLSTPCPLDKTNQLRHAVKRLGNKVFEGCYVINNRGNAIVKWSDGSLVEVAASVFDVKSLPKLEPGIASGSSYSQNPTHKGPEDKLPSPIPQKATAQLDLLPETIAHTSYATMLGEIRAVQLQNLPANSKRCDIAGPVFKAVMTVSVPGRGTKIIEGSEACWYADLEDKIQVEGLSGDTGNTFHESYAKTDLTITSSFNGWPAVCQTKVAARRFRCQLVK